MVELADTRDLKSLDGDIVPVRPRLAAPVESLDAQVAFGAFALLRLFPRACGGFRFVSASRTEPGRSPRPRRSLFFCLIARADGAQLFVGGSESSASTRKSRSGLFSAALSRRFCLPRPVRGKGEKIGAGPLEKPRGLGYTGNRPARGRLDSGGEDNAEICTVDENA